MNDLIQLYPFFLIMMRFRAVASWGGWGVGPQAASPPFLADQLTLSQPGRQIIPTTLRPYDLIRLLGRSKWTVVKRSFRFREDPNYGYIQKRWKVPNLVGQQ